MKHQDPHSTDDKINRGCMIALVIFAWLFVVMFGFCVGILV